MEDQMKAMMQSIGIVENIISFFKTETAGIPEHMGIHMDAEREIITIYHPGHDNETWPLRPPTSPMMTKEKIKKTFGTLTRNPGAKEFLWLGNMGNDMRWIIEPETGDFRWCPAGIELNWPFIKHLK